MSIFNIVSSYEDAWKAIIMPPRQEYTSFDLGPTDFTVKGSRVSRTDFRLLNKRGHVIECSFFQHVEIEDPIPCVIYLHGNGCSRLEALQYSHLVLSNKFSFFCFDFSACGKSEGQYTSIGWFEQDDLDCILQYIYKTERVSKVAIWGRSMGGVTTLYYAEKDPRISCIVIDSAFSKFKRVVKELAKEKASIPEFLAAGAFGMIRKTILKKAKFDIGALRPIKHVHKLKVPALFGTGENDTYVLAGHTKDLYAAYGGPKELMVFEGDHNSDRPVKWCLKVTEFLKKHLLSDNKGPEPLSKLLKNYVKGKDTSLRSTAESLNDLTEDRSLKKFNSYSIEPKGLPFTWLDHNSCPNKPANTQPTRAGKKSHTAFINGTHTNAPAKAQANAQVSYTVEPIQKAMPKSETNLDNLHFHETPKFGASKPMGNGSLNEVPSSFEGYGISKHGNSHGKSSQAYSLNDLDNFHSYHGHHSPYSGYKESGSTPQVSYGQNISGPGSYMASNCNPQPKSYQVGDTPHLTLGSPVQTFSDTLKGFSDASTGRHIDKHTPSSTKSYLSGGDQNKSQGLQTPFTKINVAYVGSDYGFNSIANNQAGLIHY